MKRAEKPAFSFSTACICRRRPCCWRAAPTAAAARSPIMCPTFGTPGCAAELVPLEAGYKIAPMDTVTVKVFKMPDLTGDYEVDLAGHISMPLIGEVTAYDLTTAQLDECADPQAGREISRKSGRQRRHQIVDPAQRHGRRRGQQGRLLSGPWTDDADAGGRRRRRNDREDANARRVAIFRTIGGQRQAAAFDLTSIRRGEAQDPQVYAGDIVVIDGSAIKAAAKADSEQPAAPFDLPAVLMPWRRPDAQWRSAREQ